MISQAPVTMMSMLGVVSPLRRRALLAPPPFQLHGPVSHLCVAALSLQLMDLMYDLKLDCVGNDTPAQLTFKVMRSI